MRSTVVGDASKTAMRSPAVFKLREGLLFVVLLLCIAPTAEAAPSWNVGYRTIALQDAVTGESFAVAVWYPTPAAPAPLFVTGSLSLCRLPAIVCRGIAFEMPVAQDAPVAAGAFGVIVVSHGAGGMALLHRDLAMALALQGYVVGAPTHPRGKGGDISGVSVWVGRPKQVSRVIDAVLDDGELGAHIERERIGVVGHSNGATRRWQSPVPDPVPAQRLRIAASIPTTPSSAATGVLPLGKPLARSATFQSSAIRGYGPLC
jgi:predicted dienelactone hydrolase